MSTVRKCLLLLMIVAAPAAHAQGPAVGRLLVSEPGLDDPNFSESVLLILIHEDGSSAAIFLNRPTWVDPAEAFPEVEGLEAYGNSLFLGGPVAPEQILTLFEYDGPPPVGARNIFGDIYLSPTPEVFNAIDFGAEDAPRARVYAGHAQWAGNQLAQEIAAGDWRLVNARVEHVFSDDPAELWSRLPGAGDEVTASLN